MTDLPRLHSSYGNLYLLFFFRLPQNHIQALIPYIKNSLKYYNYTYKNVSIKLQYNIRNQKDQLNPVKHHIIMIRSNTSSNILLNRLKRVFRRREKSTVSNTAGRSRGTNNTGLARSVLWPLLYADRRDSFRFLLNKYRLRQKATAIYRIIDTN